MLLLLIAKWEKKALTPILSQTYTNSISLISIHTPNRTVSVITGSHQLPIPPPSIKRYLNLKYREGQTDTPLKATITSWARRWTKWRIGCLMSTINAGTKISSRRPLTATLTTPTSQSSISLSQGSNSLPSTLHLSITKSQNWLNKFAEFKIELES